MQPERTISEVTMPKSQESLSLGLSPPCYTSQYSPLHSTSTLSNMLVEDHIVGQLMAQEKAVLEDKSSSVNGESETPGCCIRKASLILTSQRIPWPTQRHLVPQGVYRRWVMRILLKVALCQGHSTQKD